MTVKSTNTKRFTLMLPGEDALAPHAVHETPPKGLPHERFLLGDHLPIAAVMLLGESEVPLNADQVIACLQPVHLHATRDHLILMSQNQIDLTREDSTTLLNAALPLIEEDFQHAILFHGVRDWFIPAGPFAHLETHSIDQAHGRNIDWWMPRDTQTVGIAKMWRKLQNEIQMLWHIDPVNQAREQLGKPTINSIWISGIGKLRDLRAPEKVKNSTLIYGDHPLLRGLAKYLQIPHHNGIHFAQLCDAFAWVHNPQDYWESIKQALVTHHITEFEIIDFPNGKARSRTFTAHDLQTRSWMFWKKPIPLTWQEIASS